jgi:hypothetical protein
LAKKPGLIGRAFIFVDNYSPTPAREPLTATGRSAAPAAPMTGVQAAARKPSPLAVLEAQPPALEALPV